MIHVCTSFLILFKAELKAKCLFLEHEGRQVQPVHPGTRMGKPAGRTTLLQKCFLFNLLNIILNYIHKLNLCLPQKMSHSRVNQLRELQGIIDEISRAIMWVNEREEEELMFDWGDKNIDQYIPRKQESYSVRISS